MTTTIRRLLVGLALAATASGARADQATRTERDLLGEKQVPADAYYGVQTARALENFQISGVTIGEFPEFVQALALVKIAAARANAEAGTLDPATRDAIERAAREIADGRHHEQFRVDWFQGGAGTSTNMNINEVIANVALERMGKPRGDYATLDPHDHVNLSQSTNDSYPTSLKVAFLLRNDGLVAEVQALADAFRRKGAEYLTVLKMGRTEMQDAVPMTVGQELHAFAAGLESEIAFLRLAEQGLYTINMGGTAIGTRLNAAPGFPAKTAAQLAALTGKPIVAAQDLIAATWDLQAFLNYSSALRSLAVKLSKIASDLILLSSGPRAGLGELELPPMQPGSSIMPGKVNPVMPEMTNLVAFRVIGNDTSVMLAAKSGQLQLNAYEPLVGLAVMESQGLLVNVMKTLRLRAVDGMTVNEAAVRRHIDQTVGIVTALNPVIGYDRATELAREAYDSGKGILEIVREKQVLTDEQLRGVLDPAKLTGLDPAAYPKPKPVAPAAAKP